LRRGAAEVPLELFAGNHEVAVLPESQVKFGVAHSEYLHLFGPVIEDVALGLDDLEEFAVLRPPQGLPAFQIQTVLLGADQLHGEAALVLELLEYFQEEPIYGAALAGSIFQELKLFVEFINLGGISSLVLGGEFLFVFLEFFEDNDEEVFEFGGFLAFEGVEEVGEENGRFNIDGEEKFFYFVVVADRVVAVSAHHRPVIRPVPLFFLAHPFLLLRRVVQISVEG
jgi:hypothetical protein